MASENMVQSQCMKRNREWITLVEFALTPHQPCESRAADRVVSILRGLHLAAAFLDRVDRAIRAALLRATPNNHTVSIRVFTRNVNARFVPEVEIAPSGWGFFLVDRPVPSDAEGECHIIDVFLYAENHQPGQGATTPDLAS